jgi:tocopherol O-methyltransferase
MPDDTPPPPSVERIRFHYDFLAPFYYLLWGEHLHHGYWDGPDDPAAPAEAQERLIARLYALAGRPPAARVLDLGCGFAGSTLWLAKNGAGGTFRRAVGVTISPVQQAVAQARLARAGLGKRARIVLADAARPWPFDDGEFDLLWCCEMTEHLPDRAHWAREAFRVLAPGGTLCLAAWLAGPRAVSGEDPEAARLCADVARDTVGHPFSTAEEFVGFLCAAGFDGVRTETLAPHVARTWEIAERLRERPFPKLVARLTGGDIAAYARSFSDLRRALTTGAMDYGLFAARKPAGEI